MSAMKKMMIDGMTVDPETGAVLTPQPESALEDYRRGAEWEKEIQASLRSGRMVNWTNVSRRVQDRAGRARGMDHKGRRALIAQEEEGLYVFNVQKTRQFENGVWPAEGYLGWIKIKSGHIAGGDCSCPDNNKERAVLPNGVTYCKHMGLVKLRAARKQASRAEPRPNRPVADCLWYDRHV